MIKNYVFRGRNELRLSLRVQLPERLNWMLRLSAAERGSFPLPLSCLWCLCNCTGSWSRLLIREKTLLAETVNGLSWISGLADWNPEVEAGDEQGAEL